MKSKLLLGLVSVLGGSVLMAQSAYAYSFSLTPDATTTSAFTSLGETFAPYWMQAIAFVVGLFGVSFILILTKKGVMWLWRKATSFGGR